MYNYTNGSESTINLHRASLVLTAVLMLSLLAGCDPCMNNPCDDGIACNGLETCTASGAQPVCGDGTPIVCEPGTACTEPDGMCVADDPCAGVVCDMSDLCNPETCVDGTCVAMPVDCPAGETCDPATGMCSALPPGMTGITKISEVTGTYTGASTCGDDDDQVTFSTKQGVLTLSGFTGNADISLTIVDDLTATADNVTAFGVSGHALKLILNRSVGYIGTSLTRPGASCSTDLMKLMP